MHLIICPHANERRKDLLVQAEQARRIDHARRNRTFLAGRDAAGTQVAPARPIPTTTTGRTRPGGPRCAAARQSAGHRASDPAGRCCTVGDAFDRLSQASRRRRFLGVQNDQAGCATPHRDKSWT
jgi:hypothetical protein